MANHSDKLAVAADLHPDDTKTVLRVLIGDALDHPGEHLPIRRVRLRFHEVPCAAADAFLHLCAVGAFEIDLPSNIGAMQLSPASGEAPCAEEHMDSEGISEGLADAVGIDLADQSPLGPSRIRWPQRINPWGPRKKASRLSSRKSR